MDSLTQIALGAAVGGAVGGRQLGRRALLWGALCGTLPDLDVLVPFADAVQDFTYHRSASHSLPMFLLATPLLVWLILRFHPDTRAHRTRWAVLVYLVLATHALLDAFTVYGTQILWPFDTTPVAWSTIFIIDPLYTLPLLIGVVAATSARGRGWGWRTNAIGLALSCAYLGWTVAAKAHVEQRAQQALAVQGIAATSVLTTPGPFNSLLWRVLAVDRGAYYEAFYSVLDGAVPPRFVARPRSLALVETFRDSPPVARLSWFTKDFYRVARVGDDIVITDLRMGLDPDYVFSFRVGTFGNPHPHPAPVRRVATERDFSRLGWVWARIWDPAARLE